MYVLEGPIGAAIWECDSIDKKLTCRQLALLLADKWRQDRWVLEGSTLPPQPCAELPIFSSSASFREPNKQDENKGKKLHKNRGKKRKRTQGLGAFALVQLYPSKKKSIITIGPVECRSCSYSTYVAC